MAIVFLEGLFGNDIAPRVMAGIIAFSILGNIIVMTFTASRGEAPLAIERDEHCEFRGKANRHSLHQ